MYTLYTDSKHHFFLFSGHLFSTPDNLNLFNFPWRFELSGVDCTSVKLISRAIINCLFLDRNLSRNYSYIHWMYLWIESLQLGDGFMVLIVLKIYVYLLLCGSFFSEWDGLLVTIIFNKIDHLCSCKFWNRRLPWVDKGASLQHLSYRHIIEYREWFFFLQFLLQWDLILLKEAFPY